MSENSKNTKAIAKRRGLPIYTSNPSVPPDHELKKIRRAQYGDEHKGIIVDSGSGEIVGHGVTAFYEFEEVDKERFVKLFLAGLQQAAALSKAGLAVFKLVYGIMRESPGRDTVLLDVISSGLEERTFHRGLRELLEKEFLYRSTNPGLFFVNIRFMFNGDRLAFVKGYQLKKEKDSNQLPLL